MKELRRDELYELVRDHTDVTGAQFLLLQSLAWRANPKKGYSCFPSYARLVRDTHVAEQNLRIAARGLEAAGYIKRVKRYKRANVFFLNVPLLLKLAAERTSPPEDEAEDVNAWVSPFEDKDIDNTDGLEHNQNEPEEEQDRPLCHTLDDVVGTVRGMWPEHPTFFDVRGEEFLQADLGKCVDMAQSPERCGLLLNYVYMTNDAAFASVGRSKQLGRYLLKCFPNWLRLYEDKLLPTGNEIEVVSE